MIRNLLLRFLVSPCKYNLVWLPIVLSILGFFATIGIYFPGEMIGMSQHSYKESVSQNYTDGHPAMYAVTWRAMRAIQNSLGFAGTGQAALFAIQTIILWLGFYLVLHACKNFWKNRQGTAQWKMLCCICFVTIICADIVIHAGIISKDNMFWSCYLFATGLLLNMPKHWIPKTLAAAIVLFFLYYGTSLRHNALLALFPLLCWLTCSFCGMHVRRGISLLAIMLISATLWGSYIFINNYVTYSVFKSYRLYMLSERFYADIFMLNYFGNHYENPPNVFRNRFDDLTEEIFRDNYQHRCMYVVDAMKFVCRKMDRPFPLVWEGYEPAADPAFDQEQWKEDFQLLQKAWIKRITQEPLIYMGVRGYFVLQFFFIDTPITMFLCSLGLCNGVSLLIIMFLTAFRYTFFKKQLNADEIPFVLLAWSAILYALPLFIFLPENGPGNIRYLYWFFAASFISIAYFLAHSPLFAAIMQTVQQYGEEKALSKRL